MNMRELIDYMPGYEWIGPDEDEDSFRLNDDHEVVWEDGAYTCYDCRASLVMSPRISLSDWGRQLAEFKVRHPYTYLMNIHEWRSANPDA